MAAFALRLLDLPLHHDVLRKLDALRAGDRAARAALAAAMSHAIQDPGLLQRNDAMSGSLERWHAAIDALRDEGAAVDVETVAEAAIALLAMPGFQFTYGAAGLQPSPSLVVLGEDDGGLYGAMLAHDARIADVFSARPGRDPEPYAVMGEGMIVLTPDEVATLRAIADGTPASGVAQTAQARLVALLDESLRDEERAIAVSFEN